MTQLQVLTMRTTAALGRLAELQRRAEQVSASSVPVVKPALKELSAALEELKVANEQLHAQLEEVMAARAGQEEIARRFKEFVAVIPTACVWTDETGLILEANDAAADLLNVARARLPGKPLMLFLGDRQAFFESLKGLSAPDAGGVELQILVRPRERRPRAVRLTARVLEHDTRWCWFFQPADVAVVPGGEVEEVESV